MPNCRLTAPEIESLEELQARVVAELDTLAGGDPELLFAFRRRLFTRLMHLERGTPAQRSKLKAEKWKSQDGRCAMCQKPMPQKGSELDRFVAWKGYTAENTRLLHHDCHVEDQRRKGFSDAEVAIVEQIEDLDDVSNLVDSCEIWQDGDWVLIGVEDALKLDRAVDMRCPACHGRVRPHSLGSTGQKAHFEHRPSYAGCRLKATGTIDSSTLHPDALR